MLDMIWRIFLTVLLCTVYIGGAWLVMTGGMFLKRWGNSLLRKMGLEQLSFRLPLLAFLIIFGVAVVIFIIDLVIALQEWDFQGYLLTSTPVGSVMLSLLEPFLGGLSNLNFWGKLVMLLYQTGFAGIGALIITILSSSFYRYLHEERGMTFFPAAMICFGFSLVVSKAVSFLIELIPTEPMALGFTGAAHGFVWLLLLLLLIAFVAFFSVGWFGEMLLQVARYIGLAMVFSYARGILNGTKDFEMKNNDPLFWIVIILLVIYWIIRALKIEALEDRIEAASDDFVASRGKRSFWAPFFY